MDDQIKDYLAAIGRRGGKAKGPKKRRSPEFYKELSRKGVEARKRKADRETGDG